MNIRRLADLIVGLKGKRKFRVVGVNAVDSHSLPALYRAVEMGLIEAAIIGDPEQFKDTCRKLGINPANFQFFPESVDVKSVALAVDMVEAHKADVLMKGLISTDKFIKVLLRKESGLVEPGGFLSHITIMEHPGYHKLLVASDAAIVPLPNLEQKVRMTDNLIHLSRSLGVEQPKIAVIAPTEQVLPGIESCIHGAVLSKMYERGQIKGGMVDGPLALDVAIDKEAAELKGIRSEVAGDADALLFPNLDAANVFYKLSTKLAGAEFASIVVGAKVPIVLSSRDDSIQTKLYSIALGSWLAGNEG